MEYKKGDIFKTGHSDYPAICIEKIKCFSDKEEIPVVIFNETQNNINNSIDITKLEIKNDSNIKYLLSIREYKGDYIIVEEQDMIKINLDNFEKIYEIMQYDEWWIELHRDIYNGIILNLLC